MRGLSLSKPTQEKQIRNTDGTDFADLHEFLSLLNLKIRVDPPDQ
jgi:hypothetical protein